jgi:hypothetical protein
MSLATANAVLAPDAWQQPIDALLASFRPIGLQDLGAAALMDRVDSKFLLPAYALAPLLDRFAPGYRLLEVAGSRTARYSTTYYDTAELMLYHAHRAGRLPRFKVRARTYVDSGERFLEVKRKSNAGRTRKVRMRITTHVGDELAAPGWGGMLDVQQQLPVDRLGEALRVEFSRLTLVRDNVPERITLDYGLAVFRHGCNRSFPGIVIAEVKQERRGRSCFRDAARDFRVRRGSLSKYCLGIASLEPGVRCNPFRQTLRRIDGISAAATPQPQA